MYENILNSLQSVKQTLHSRRHARSDHSTSSRNHPPHAFHPGDTSDQESQAFINPLYHPTDTLNHTDSAAVTHPEYPIHRAMSAAVSNLSTSSLNSPVQLSNPTSLEPTSEFSPPRLKPSPILNNSNTRIPFPAPRSSISVHRHGNSTPLADSTPSKPSSKSGVSPSSKDEVNMLKDQLARLQSELRLARGQSSKHDSSNSRSATPSNHKRTTIEQRSSQSQNSPSTSFTPSPAQQKPRNRSRVTRKRSSLTSENSDGLSIRLISGPGLVQTSPAFSSTEGLPTTESGYIKNAKGEWVPIRTNVSIDGDGSSGNALGQSGRKSSTDDGRGPSRIPVSAVSMGRVLAGDTAARLLGSDDEASEGATPDGSEERARADAARAVPPASHTAARRRQTRQPHPLMTLNETDGAPESSPGSACFSPGRESRSSVSQDESGVEHNQASSTSSHHVNAGRQSRTNPFFGSGGGRDRGAMIHQSHAAERALNGGNTGRVITNLQSDLLYARTALDQSKSQLRLSQRAVESLTRQTEDLKESMSRLRLENEGLSKMLARKERTVSELMERIKKSESELSTIKVEKKELDVTCKKLTKETEEIVKDSVRRRDRAETQYEAVRSGVKSLSDGWKRDVSGLKSDMQKLEEKHRKELEESRLKYNTLAKLHASRSGALSKLESTLTSLQSTKDTIVKEYSIELKTLQASLKADQAESETSLLMAKEVASECARFKRMLRDYHG